MKLHNTYCKYYTKYLFVFLLLVLYCFSLKASSGKYPIQNFTPSDYKAGNQNIAFSQNRDMEIFVANNLGVMAFDGHSWENHGSRTGKKQRSLAFDETTNRLYLGSQGEFGYFTDSWQYVSLVEQLPENAPEFDEVWDVYILNSNIVFCTFQGLFVYNGESITVLEHTDGFYRSFMANGKLFVQSQSGVMLELTDGGLVRTQAFEPLNQRISAVIYFENGYIVFYNSGDITYSKPFGVGAKFESLAAALKGNYVNHVLQLSDSRLAISTQTSGIFLYNSQEEIIEQLTVNDGLQSNACLNSYQDYSGNLWVGMQNGLALIDINSPLRLINRDAQLEGSGYDAFETENGVYYSTSNGIYFAPTGQSSRFINGTEGPAYGFKQIDNRLYAGHHTGLFSLTKGNAELILRTNGLWQIKRLRSQPGYALGGTYSGLYLFDVSENGIVTPIKKVEGFDESSRFFEEDRKGKILVGQFYKGLFELTLSTDLTRADVKRIEGSATVPIDDQIILSRIDNELFLGTNEGVFKIDENTGNIVRAELFKEDIGNQPVYLLSQDKDKNIHVIAEERAGLYKQISQQNYAFIPASLFQLRYSINNDLLNVSVDTNEGVLFSANEGFIQYSPQLETQFTIGEQLVISDLYSVTQDSLLYSSSPFEERTEQLPELTIKAGAKVLQFSVDAFQFDNVNSQQFRYFLKGFDDDYGEWSTASTKEYTNLREGNYEFYAQSRNYLGEINDSLPLAFKVKPPLYRTNFAKLFYLALGLFSIILASRLQKTKYKKKVQVQINESEQKIFAIEQEKEQVVIKLEEEKIQNELRHVNNQLAASTMNLVVKNEFIETIKEELTEVNRRGKNVETKKALQQIVKEIDITLRLQEDWVQFEHHFDKVHGDFLSRLRNTYKDLTPNEQKLCALLRLNLSTKEIANMMSISQRGVEIARYRLRKKLKLEKGQNLSKFVLEY